MKVSDSISPTINLNVDTSFHLHSLVFDVEFFSLMLSSSNQSPHILEFEIETRSKRSHHSQDLKVQQIGLPFPCSTSLFWLYLSHISVLIVDGISQCPCLFFCQIRILHTGWSLLRTLSFSFVRSETKRVIHKVVLTFESENKAR